MSLTQGLESPPLFPILHVKGYGIQEVTRRLQNPKSQYGFLELHDN